MSYSVSRCRTLQNRHKRIADSGIAAVIQHNSGPAAFTGSKPNIANACTIDTLGKDTDLIIYNQAGAAPSSLQGDMVF